MLFINKIIKKTLNFLRGPFLSLAESLTANDGEKSLPNPPIFFLGAPRSGTTLAMQLITDSFDLGYISNFHCKYYGAPAVAERIFRPIDGRPRSSYKSVHGRTSAHYDPSECGEWWYRFFRRSPRYVDLAGANDRKMLRFRKSVWMMIKAFGRPVLFKNPHAALRIQPIVKYLPESLFIIMKRDEIDNAHSLLEVRNKVHGDYGKWWSMEPPSIELLQKLPAHQQVVEQIRHIYATVDRDLALSGVSSHSCFHLNYEELCDNPRDAMERLEEFFRYHGCRIERRYTPPESFPRRNDVRVDKDLYEKVKNYANQS